MTFKFHARSESVAACRALSNRPVGLLAVALSLGSSTHVLAQQTQAPAVLPPIVVEGATLAKPIAKAGPKKKPQVADDEGQDQGGASKKAKSAAAAAQGQAGSGSGAVEIDESAGSAGQGAAGFDRETLGTSVTVVTGQEIDKQQVRNAADALRALPGVQVSRGAGFGGITDVRIRGAEANHTLVIVDGIAVNDPTTGSFDFSNLLTEGIERIEVIRGPQSGLYGSNALAGVVNVITTDGRGKPGASATARTEFGGYGTRDVATRASASNGTAWFSVGHHWREVAGFNVAAIGNEDDPVRFSQLSLRGGVEPIDGLVVDFSLRKFTKNAARDGYDGPDGGFAGAFDDASSFTSDILATGLNIRYDSRDGSFTHLVRLSRLASSVVDKDAAFGISDNEGIANRYAYLATWRFATPALAAKHSLTSLVEQQDDRFIGNGLSHERGQLAFAGEWRGEFADRLTLTGSVRHDDSDSFDDVNTWRASTSLSLRELGLRPHASVGTGVKLPTMFEQFGQFGLFLPNPGLQAEKSFGWDAGVELTLFGGRAIFDVTYFEQDLENKIRTTFTGAINLPGISTRDGVEVAARLRVVDGVTVGGSYTWLDAIDADGQEEARRARHAARFDFDYVFAEGRGNLNLAALYNGRARDDGFFVLFHDPFGYPALDQRVVYLDPYWLLTVSASYKLTPNVELFGRVENALDTEYREQVDYATPGIAAYGGVRVSLDALADRVSSK
ncbi:MAG: TonB-dependent receptor [Hyphomicrobiaceae bacterium]|nr:TonB-dependent receptor [Hyphomicrobiaceae bacterium]